MAQPISRLYASRDNAKAAVAALQQNGFGDDAIHIVAPGDPVASEADDGVEAAVLAAGVPAAHARVYADGIRRGETLVTVQAAFGFATRATTILSGYDPTETELPEAPVYQAPAGDPATPLSSWLGWRVLLHNPTPLSSWLGWRTLKDTDRPATSGPVRPDDPAPLSGKVGMTVLSDDPAPLSKRFGWRVLSDDPAPLSKRFGWSVLSGDPAPLSTRFGWRLLSDDPAPLSTRLGWRLLCDDPMPLTNWYRRTFQSGSPPKP